MFFISKKLKLNKEINLDDKIYDETLLKWQVSNINIQQKNIILKLLIDNFDTYYNKSKSFNYHIYNLLRLNLYIVKMVYYISLMKIFKINLWDFFIKMMMIIIMLWKILI